MFTQHSLLSGALRGFAAIKGFFRPSRRGLRGEELREWANSQPGLAEEARQGFTGIEEGRYRKVSRHSST